MLLLSLDNVIAVFFSYLLTFIVYLLYVVHIHVFCSLYLWILLLHMQAFID